VQDWNYRHHIITGSGKCEVGVLAFHNCLVPHFPPLQFVADNSSPAFPVSHFQRPRAGNRQLVPTLWTAHRKGSPAKSVSGIWLSVCYSRWMNKLGLATLLEEEHIPEDHQPVAYTKSDKGVIADFSGARNMYAVGHENVPPLLFFRQLWQMWIDLNNFWTQKAGPRKPLKLLLFCCCCSSVL